MLEAFSLLSKLLRSRRLHINGMVFRFHCTLTVILLMSFFIINSTKQIIGQPIACDIDKQSINKDVLNAYCYIRSTYSLVESDRSLIYPGVAHSGLSQRLSQAKIVYHYYYQWVWCLLLIQAVCFYFPRWLWKSFESDKISSLVSGLNYFTVEPEKRENKSSLIAEYLCKTRGTNNWYCIKYYLCELLALINVVAQIFIIDAFLCGQFLSLGFDFILYLCSDSTINVDPVSKVFPILSKCSFARFGISGSNDYLNFLCLLSINILNQKIFIFLWFWYLFLAIITVFVIIFRLTLILSPMMRYQCSRNRFDFYKTKNCRNQELVINKLYLGDWFILYLLGHNIEPIVFSEILDRMHQLNEELSEEQKCLTEA